MDAFIKFLNDATATTLDLHNDVLVDMLATSNASNVVANCGQFGVAIAAKKEELVVNGNNDKVYEVIFARAKDSAKHRSKRAV
jgi:hypothetical protein